MSTVREVVEIWKRNTTRQQGERTLEERLRLLGLFVEKFGDTEVAQLSPMDVELWISFNPQWVSDWTLKRVKSTFNVPFNWAADAKRRYIDRNPLAGLTHCDGRRGRPLTQVEFRAWLRKSSAVFRRVLFFLRLAGVRPGELSELEWTGEDSYIDTERGCAVWIKHKTSRKQKVKKPRVVPLHPILIRLLVWIRRNQESERIFLNSHNKPWKRNSFALRIMRLRVKTETPKSAKLYGARHMFATDLVKKKVNLATLAELLGHASTRMTEYYVHLAGEVEHLHQAIDQGFGGGGKPELTALSKALSQEKPKILPFPSPAQIAEAPPRKAQSK